MMQTVFVIDDDEAARSSLTFLFRAEGLTSRGFAGAQDFLDQLHPDHQGCIVTDIRMPQMDGLTLVRVLNERGSTMPVIVITGHADVPMAVQAMKAGVMEFIEKPFDSAVILKAVRGALEEALTRKGDETRRAAIERRLNTLTDRESQVLTQVVEGWSNKEIANILGISPRTVEIHRANLMSKMQADSLSGLVRMALTVAA